MDHWLVLRTLARAIVLCHCVVPVGGDLPFVMRVLSVDLLG